MTGIRATVHPAVLITPKSLLAKALQGIGQQGGPQSSVEHEELPEHAAAPAAVLPGIDTGSFLCLISYYARIVSL